ncbi:MAG: TIGR03546 family protein [candidate division WOR-3 bacterium]
MLINWIAKIFVAINSNKKSSGIALSISFAFVLAMIPKTNILWLSIFILTFFLNLNQAIELIFIAIFSLPIKFLDPLLDKIGFAILTIPSLSNFFTKLFNNPFLYLTKYYNSIVMGGFVLGVLLFLPIYFLSKFLIDVYRDKLRERVANNKFIQALLQQPLITNLKNTFSTAVRFYENIR